MIDLGVDSHYALLGVEPDATPAQIRQARDSLTNELKKRVRQEPSRKAELVARQELLNKAGNELLRQGKREQYDMHHEHLRFFTVRSATAGMFANPQDRIDVLHRVISAHLRAAGVHIRPLSDLDRADFTADLTPNSLLDELIGQS